MQGRIYYGVGYPGDALAPDLYLERSKAEAHLDGVELELAAGLRLLTVQVVSVEPGSRAEREARAERAARDTLPAPPLADEQHDLGGEA
jgi:hypothetical protein